MVESISSFERESLKLNNSNVGGGATPCGAYYLISEFMNLFWQINLSFKSNIQVHIVIFNDKI